MMVLRLWCLIFGIAFPFKVNPSPVDSSSSARASMKIKNSGVFLRVEKAILKSMGMKARPRPRRGLKIPKYMQELYDSHEQDPEWISTNFRFNSKWTSVNTVRAFQHQDDLPISHPDTPGRPRLKFDISSLPKQERVQSAELRLYKGDLWTSRNGPEIRINVYQITHSRSPSSLENRTLIASQTVNLGNSGWESFDVRSAVEHWISNPLDKNNLEVHISTKEGHSLNFTSEDVIRNLSMDKAPWHDHRPLLVVYTHDALRHHHVRKKRSASNSRLYRKRKRPQYCQRHPLYVDFSDVGWNDWIVAPPGYFAFYCNGQCPYPITKHLNATNHAIVQTVMNSVDPKVPNVCCVPTTLTPISMLYMDEYEKVVLKNYQDMVVEGCGCR